MRAGTRKRVLVLSFSLLHLDSRIQRQLVFLRDEYDVTVVGFSHPGTEGVRFVQIPRSRYAFKNKFLTALRLKAKRFEEHYWSSSEVRSAMKLLANGHFDLVLANDIETLPLACALCQVKGSRLFLDAHEYKPREFDDRFVFRFFFEDYWDYLCRTYLPHVDAMSTVCEGIASQYEKVYGVKCLVVMNAPFYKELDPSKVEKDSVRMIHHGSLNKERKMESMLQLMDFLDDRFHLDFMLVNSDPTYFRKLYKLGRGSQRVRFISPVSSARVAETINSYDMGLFCLSPSNFNYRMALPNKLFEFIQGRLLVAIWPSPEMARVVKSFGCGVVSEEFSVSSMAKILNKLTPDEIADGKRHSDKAARILCAERNKDIVVSAVKNLIG